MARSRCRSLTSSRGHSSLGTRGRSSPCLMYQWSPLSTSRPQSGSRPAGSLLFNRAARLDRELWILLEWDLEYVLYTYRSIKTLFSMLFNIVFIHGLWMYVHILVEYINLQILCVNHYSYSQDVEQRIEVYIYIYIIE